MLALVVVFLLALGAGALGGLVGTGSSLVLLPVLVLLYGPREAVPMMGIAAVMANIGRVAAWWPQIRWRPVLAYAVPGAPAAALGAHTLLAISPKLIDGFLAVFFLVMIPVRRTMTARAWRVQLWQLGVAGAVVGFLTGLVLSQRRRLSRIRSGQRAGALHSQTRHLRSSQFSNNGSRHSRTGDRGRLDDRPLSNPPTSATTSSAHLRPAHRRGPGGRRRWHVRRHMLWLTYSSVFCSFESIRARGVLLPPYVGC
jgi:hypothetical protein